MIEFSLDAEGYLIGSHPDSFLVHDITDDPVLKNPENQVVLGRLQLGTKALTVQGKIERQAASFVCYFINIKTVENEEVDKAKKIRIGGVVITRLDNRKYKIYNTSSPSTNAAFVAFFYPALLERVAQGKLERENAEKKLRLEHQKAEEAQIKQKDSAMEPARIEKLKKLVQVSKKLKIAQIAQILDMSEKSLYDRIVDWAANFGFILDEDVVEFEAGRKDDFIASLDAAFKDWGGKVESKAGKI